MNYLRGLYLNLTGSRRRHRNRPSCVCNAFPALTSILFLNKQKRYKIKKKNINSSPPTRRRTINVKCYDGCLYDFYAKTTERI